MPDDIPVGTPAPAATPTPAPATPAPAVTPPAPAPVVVAPQAPATPAPAPTGEPPKEGDPNWLKQRIDQNARNVTAKVLKDLGVTTVEEAKAKIDAAKKLEDEKKTDIQRATDQVRLLEPEAQKAKRLETTVLAYAARELAALTEAQRVTVVGLAGEDPSAQLETIEKLKAGGLLTAPAPATTATAAPATAQRPAVPPPASTSSAGGAPPPASPTNPDHKATYEKLTQTNPMAAAAYALRHEPALFGDGTKSQ